MVWQSKHVNGKVELRNSFSSPPYDHKSGARHVVDYADVLIICTPNSARISMNGPAYLMNEDIIEMISAINAAQVELLEDVDG